MASALSISSRKSAGASFRRAVAVSRSRRAAAGGFQSIRPYSKAAQGNIPATLTVV